MGFQRSFFPLPVVIDQFFTDDDVFSSNDHEMRNFFSCLAFLWDPDQFCMTVWIAPTVIQKTAKTAGLGSGVYAALKIDEYEQRHTEVRWHPGQETSLVLPLFETKFFRWANVLY